VTRSDIFLDQGRDADGAETSAAWVAAGPGDPDAALLVQDDLGVPLPDSQGDPGDARLDSLTSVEDRGLAVEGLLLHGAVQRRVIQVPGAEQLLGWAAGHHHMQHRAARRVAWPARQQRGRAAARSSSFTGPACWLSAQSCRERVTA